MKWNIKKGGLDTDIARCVRLLTRGYTNIVNLSYYASIIPYT